MGNTAKLSEIISREVHKYISLNERKEKKGGLGHHLVIAGFFSHAVIDIALSVISTDLG